MANRFALKGNICFSTSPVEMTWVHQGYVICEDGICRGVFQSLPEGDQGIRVVDYKDRLIIPGLVDLHVHAPQYSFRGLHMDMELIEWLESNTFPEEAKYADPAYAKEGYMPFVEDLRKGATTRACIFGTVHKDATLLLMDLLESTGLVTYVGKVNMDRNAPDYLIEQSADTSALMTRKWIEACEERYVNTRPILTPRFTPSCTDELMQKLKDLQREYLLPVQSHLSENYAEIEWVKKLCPDTKFYGQAYEQFGLFGGTDTPTIMAHCVHSSDEEIALMKENGVFIAHCPQSNTNLSSGIAPTRRYLDEGLNMGLGSDVAGGHVTSIFRAMADAIQMSKLRWRLVDQSRKALDFEEAFYLGTMGGGSFFGKVGSFQNGYEFDAVVLDDRRLPTPRKLTLPERLERLIYFSDDREIYEKYVRGEKIWTGMG